MTRVFGRSLTSGRNDLPQGGGYRYRGIPGWNPARDLPPLPSGNPAVRKPPAQCGTLAGRSRHIRLHETICDPCRAAHNEYTRERKRELRARQREVTS